MIRQEIDYAKRIWNLSFYAALLTSLLSAINVYFNQIHRYPDGNTFAQKKYLECMKAERSEYLCKTFIKVRYNANL